MLFFVKIQFMLLKSSSQILKCINLYEDFLKMSNL